MVGSSDTASGRTLAGGGRGSIGRGAASGVGSCAAGGIGICVADGAGPGAGAGWFATPDSGKIQASGTDADGAAPLCSEGAVRARPGTASDAGAGTRATTVDAKLGRRGAGGSDAGGLTGPAGMSCGGSTGASRSRAALPALSRAAARSIRWSGCEAMMMPLLCLMDVWRCYLGVVWRGDLGDRPCGSPASSSARWRLLIVDVMLHGRAPFRSRGSAVIPPISSCGNSNQCWCNGLDAQCRQTCAVEHSSATPLVSPKENVLRYTDHPLLATKGLTSPRPDLHRFGALQPREECTLYSSDTFFNICCMTVVDISGRA